MRNLKPLTTTSYAVLGLLAVRPHTAYELARQVGRSLRWCWPRAEGRIYDEPKLLVAHGLATARVGSTGRRPKTTYRITAAGRRALAGWLAEPTDAPPELEYEALVKIGFAEHGTKVALERHLRTVLDQARADLAFGESMADVYLAGGAPFPERIPMSVRLWSFLRTFHEGMAAWAEESLAEIETWPDDLVADQAMQDRALAVLRARVR